MFIIIAGGDGVGKSTICKRLMYAIPNAEYYHFSQPNPLPCQTAMEAAKEEYFNFIDTADPNKNYIIDRFYDSEFVYAPIYRNYSIDYVNEIEHYMQKKAKSVLIYLTADLNVIIDRCNTRGENFVKNDQHTLIKENYDKFLKIQSLPILELDTSNLSVENELKYILRFLDNI